MKFVKGMIFGTMVYAETFGKNNKKIMKKGKQMIKKMGIIQLNIELKI